MPRFLAPLARLFYARTSVQTIVDAAVTPESPGESSANGNGNAARGGQEAPAPSAGPREPAVGKGTPAKKVAPHAVPAGWEDKNCPVMQPELQPTGQLGGFIPADQIQSVVDEYTRMHEPGGSSAGASGAAGSAPRLGRGLAARRAAYAEMTNSYYDLVTSFYEYGWGQSFHFARLDSGLTVSAAIARHEKALAAALKLKPLDRVLDVGCGIGGPLREISGFTGAAVTGLNNNAFQLARAAKLNARLGKGVGCDFMLGDFMAIPCPNDTFDAAYAIEATCHAPSAAGVYGEVLRVLKPGGCFGCYEWCLTPKYDPSNPGHTALKAEIELGNGLVDLRTTAAVLEGLRSVGFEVLEARDLAQWSTPAWYTPLAPDRLSFSLSGFRTTALGRLLTRGLVRGLESLRLAPRGSARVSDVLERSGDALVAGGRAGVFTPMFFFVVRKPLA